MNFKVQLLSFWEAVRTSYWFVPGLMVLGAILLSYLTTEIDHNLQDRYQVRQHRGWLYTASPDGARALLTTIAGSMISTAGVVFSITIVALALATNQFGSRMLRNFMRDVGNQIVLGTFIAAFIYCLLILRNVQGSNGDGVETFVPQISLIVALLLALAGVGVLIFFIHHVAVSIQAPHVVADIADDFRHAIDQLYPTRIGTSPHIAHQRLATIRQQVPADLDGDAELIRARSSGYIERLEPDQLLEQATARDLVLRVERRPGDFVASDAVILAASPRRRVDETARTRLRGSFTIRRERSLSQDAPFAVFQLVEIAVRALSPGINNPSTAMLCIDYLGANLGQLAQRELPSPYRLDDAGRLRVIAQPLSLCDYLDSAFTQIRQNSAHAPAIMLRLLETFEHLAPRLPDAASRTCLAEHTRMIYNQALAADPPPFDREKLERSHTTIHRLLNNPQPPSPADKRGEPRG